MLMTNDRNRVLIVEDDDVCREVLTELLRDHGFDTSAARNGREMDAALKAGGVDLLLLDLGLPGEDGLAICRRVTSGAGPAVVIVSAAGEEVDRVIGLELGADDYIAKPYGERELLARVRAVLRRRGPQPSGEAPRRAGLKLDPTRLRVQSPEGRETALSPFEFRLMQALADADGRVLSREELVSTVGVTGGAPERTVDVLVSRLRRKLMRAFGPDMIATVRGRGYSLDAAAPRDATFGSVAVGGPHP
jgi:two-component system OmpR family response regulator